MSKGKSAHSASAAATVTFQRYDTEFQEILQQIEQSLSSNTGTENGHQQQHGGDYTNHLIQQGHDLLKQMSVEARSSSDQNNNNAAMKNELLNHVRTLKSQLTTLQSKVSSQSLFGNHNHNNNNGHNSQYDKNRQVLEKNESMLLQQNDTLERAKRSILETEQVALEISDELVQNRQTLLSSQNRIHQVSGMTHQAKQLLSSMSQRQVQQKMILYGITIALVVAFFFLLYSMWG